MAPLLLAPLLLELVQLEQQQRSERESYEVKALEFESILAQTQSDALRERQTHLIVMKQEHAERVGVVEEANQKACGWSLLKSYASCTRLTSTLTALLAWRENNHIAGVSQASDAGRSLSLLGKQAALEALGSLASMVHRWYRRTAAAKSLCHLVTMKEAAASLMEVRQQEAEALLEQAVGASNYLLGRKDEDHRMALASKDVERTLLQKQCQVAKLAICYRSCFPNAESRMSHLFTVWKSHTDIFTVTRKVEAACQDRISSQEKACEEEIDAMSGRLVKLATHPIWWTRHGKTDEQGHPLNIPAKGRPVDSTASIAPYELLHASGEGNKDKVQALLESGASVNAGVLQGRTPLMAAASTGNADIVLLLVAYGADIAAQDQTGWTALRYSTEYGHKNVERILRRA